MHIKDIINFYIEGKMIYYKHTHFNFVILIWLTFY